MMKRITTQFCLLGILFSATPALGREHFPDQKQLARLDAKYELEFKSQLAGKPIAERNLDEIYIIALKASQKAYGNHPDLMRRKVLFDLEQIPPFQSEHLARYRLEQSFNLLEIFKTRHNAPVGTTQADILAVFYGRRPEAIAQTFKNMILSKAWSPQQMGQWATVSRFLPDKIYRLQDSDVSQLLIHSYDNNLFILNFDITATGLIKPISMEWMKPSKEPSSISQS